MKNIIRCSFLFVAIFLLSNCTKDLNTFEENESLTTEGISEDATIYIDDIEVLESTDRRKSVCCKVDLDENWSQTLTDLRGYLNVKVIDIRYPSPLAYSRIKIAKLNEATGKFDEVYSFYSRHANKEQCVKIRTGYGIVNFGFNNPATPGTYKITVGVATGQFVPCCPSLPGTPAPYYVEQICDSESVIVELD